MSQSRVAAGMGLMLAGTVFLLDALAIVHLWGSGGGWWPILLVIIGVVLLLRRAPDSSSSKSGSTLAILTARGVEVRERPYHGGRVTAVLGHAGLDLRETTLDRAGARLSLVAVLGDVSVTVPPGWRVKVDPRLLVADLDVDLLPAPEGAPILTVTGFGVLSDLHVRTGSVVA